MMLGSNGYGVRLTVMVLGSNGYGVSSRPMIQNSSFISSINMNAGPNLQMK
jgi:hypothetical protein